MGSYAVTANVMTFKLQDFADLTYRTTINPDFIFKISRIDTYNASYNGFIYSVIGFRLVMKRRSLKYVLNYYVPSLLFVSATDRIVSCIIIWVPVRCCVIWCLTKAFDSLMCAPNTELSFATEAQSSRRAYGKHCVAKPTLQD